MSWLDDRRARAYLIILAAMSGVATVVYLAISPLPLDPLGKPIGTDFASFWTASRLALAGRPADAWDVAVHGSAQAALFGPDAGYYAFFYPPTFLLICLPLGLAPYVASLAIWLSVTGAAWIAMARAWLGKMNGWLPIIAFPAVLINLGHGQNGFLTGALFGGAALLSERRPWLAGVLFGALVVKPHLALLVPIFFILSGNWRGFLGAGLTAVGLCLLSLWALGPSSWAGFMASSDQARLTLEQGLVGYAKMQSTFAAARLLGAPLTLSWGAQAITTLLGTIAIWKVRRSTHGMANGAALACATLLSTPFLLDYDLTLLIIPLAWLFTQARQTTFLPWERILLLIGFLLPLYSRAVAMTLNVPLAPFVVLALLACIARRAKIEVARDARLIAAGTRDGRSPVSDSPPGGASNAAAC